MLAALLSHTTPDRADQVIYSLLGIVEAESRVSGDNKVSERTIALPKVITVPPCRHLEFLPRVTRFGRPGLGVDHT